MLDDDNIGPSKPFSCKEVGCNMTFTNEDHLVVHTKNHNLLLNFELGSKASALIADQTPTPTRLIRNCEEVGLFEDLQHVNPFEETFRRAVELKSTSINDNTLDSTNTPAVTEALIAEDTLHTPHVLPLYAPNTTNNSTDKNTETNHNIKIDNLNTISRIQPNSRLKPKIKYKCKKILPENVTVSLVQLKNLVTAVPVPVLKEKTKTIRILPKSDKQNDEKNNIIAKQPIKTILKTSILEHQRLVTLNKKSTVLTQNIDLSSTSIAVKQTNPVNCDSIENSVPRTALIKSSGSNIEAAKRYRMKLKRKQQERSQKIVELQEENKKLKQRIKQLESMLSQHKDCYVTVKNAEICGTLIPVAVCDGQSIPSAISTIRIIDNGSLSSSYT